MRSLLKKSHTALIFSNLLFGVNFVFFDSIIHNYLTFQQLFAVRVLFSALFFLPFILKERLYIVKIENLKRIAFTSLLVVFGKQYLMLWGVDKSTPIDSSIIFSLGPIITILISAYQQNIKISSLRTTALIIGAAGSLLLIFFNFTPDDTSTTFGHTLILFSTISMGINTILIKPALRDMGVLKVMGWYYIFASIFVIPFFWSDIAQINFSVIPVDGILQIGCVIAFGTVLPNYLLYFGTSFSTPIHTAIYGYIQPFSTITVLLFITSLVITRSMFISLFLILISIILEIIVYYRKDKRIPKMNKS